MLIHGSAWSDKTMSNLVSKVNYVHTYMILCTQKNVQQTNKSFPLGRICICGMVKMSHAELAKFSAIS